jgi:hypothetical protein
MIELLPTKATFAPGEDAAKWVAQRSRPDS